MVGQLLLDIDYEISAGCETANYLDTSRWGYYSLCCKPRTHSTEYRVPFQRSYPLHTLPKMLELVGKDRDADHWVTQAVFTKPNRRKANFAHTGCAFVDLDYYKVRKLEDKPPEVVLDLVLKRCQEWQIPLPSLVVDSGQGLQLKWFHDKLPRVALPRWDYLQEWLNDLFRTLGADKGAKDVSRILRVVQTVNQKNGYPVRVLWQQDEGYTQEPYSFNELIQAVYDSHTAHIRPNPQNTGKSLKGNKKASVTSLDLFSRPFGEDSLNWSRVCDLQKLIELRGGDVGEGMREPMAFYLCNHFALRYSQTLALRPADEWQEFYQLCKQAAPHWDAAHIRNKTSNLYQLSRDDAAGKTVEFNGKQYRPLFTPKNRYLIDLFGITETEQRRMKTIIGTEEYERREEVRKGSDKYKEEHRKRDEKRRRAAGVMPRDEYLEQRATQADEKRKLANKLRKQGLSIRAIAEKMGVGRSTVSDYVSRGPFSVEGVRRRKAALEAFGGKS